MVPPDIWEITITSVLFALYRTQIKVCLFGSAPPNLKYIQVLVVDVVTDFSAAIISKA